MLNYTIYKYRIGKKNRRTIQFGTFVVCVLTCITQVHFAGSGRSIGQNWRNELWSMNILAQNRNSSNLSLFSAMLEKYGITTVLVRDLSLFYFTERECWWSISSIKNINSGRYSMLNVRVAKTRFQALSVMWKQRHVNRTALIWINLATDMNKPG